MDHRLRARVLVEIAIAPPEQNVGREQDRGDQAVAEIFQFPIRKEKAAISAVKSKTTKSAGKIRLTLRS